jgi:hypothetical protein
MMLSIGRIASWVAMMLLLTSVASSNMSLAEDKKLTPEALIAKHLQSIGSPDLLAKTEARAFIGTTKVRFVQGAIGEMDGQCQFASEGRKLGIILRYTGQDYRGEHFAFDGKDVTIGRFVPGKISILAEFVNRFGDLMKKGLMGGVLNVSWPSQTLQEISPRLKYKKATLAGRPMHTLEYRPKGGLEGFKIVLFFEPEIFHHVRTEYKLRISAGIGGGAATGVGIERPDSYYLLSEEFADFKEIDGVTLPQRYTIGFSSEGQTRTFVAYWTLEAEQWFHNGQIDPDIFKALEY